MSDLKCAACQRSLPTLENASLAGSEIAEVYRNHRGDVRQRRLIPLRVWYGSTRWHPEAQWLLSAIDAEDGRTKDFALSGFVRGASPPTSGPTPEDMGRDLAADLAWLIDGPVLSPLVAELRACALSGVRRALAAEAERDRLREAAREVLGVLRDRPQAALEGGVR